MTEREVLAFPPHFVETPSSGTGLRQPLVVLFMLFPALWCEAWLGASVLSGRICVQPWSFPFIPAWPRLLKKGSCACSPSFGPDPAVPRGRCTLSFCVSPPRGLLGLESRSNSRCSERWQRGVVLGGQRGHGGQPPAWPYMLFRRG